MADATLKSYSRDSISNNTPRQCVVQPRPSAHFPICQANAMPCNYAACSVGENSEMHPCSLCEKPVHHDCSLENYADATLDEKFCSPACVYGYFNEPLTQPTQEVDIVSIEPFSLADGSDSDSSEPHVVTPRSNQPPPVDEYGIPLSVKHHRRPNTRDTIWDFMHDLKSPFVSARASSKESFRNVCLVCAKHLTTTRKSQWAWERALFNSSSTSNAKVHFKNKHPEHQAIREEIDKKDLQADATVAALENAKTAIGRKRSLSGDNISSKSKAAKLTKNRFSADGTIAELMRPTLKTINSAISEWITSEGLPFNIVRSQAFEKVIRLATANPEATVLAPATHNNEVDARYRRFRKLVARLLDQEHKKALGIKFLSVQHDAWTSRTNTGVIGASAVFIDHQWRFRHIALLAGAKNDGHQAEDVARVIVDRCAELFQVNIPSITQYMVSDTTSSARKVAESIEDSQQTDCVMHRLNLCIAYGLGLKENTRTTREFNASGEQIRITRVVTKGGALDEGKQVIKKMRTLNNYFSTAQRIQRLKNLQVAHGLPVLSAMTDVDVRVGSTCKVMKRTIVNYPALRAFFHNVEHPNPFSVITSAEWELIVELEAATNYLARLALVEVQKDSMVASYLPVFRRSALNHVNASHMMCCDLESGRDERTNDDNLVRRKRTVSSFSVQGKRCISRLREQLLDRFPVLEVDTIVPLFCDPRTKDVIGSIIYDLDETGQPTTSSVELVEEARRKFISEHFRVFNLSCLSKTPTEPAGQEASPSTSPLLDELPQHDAVDILGPPIPTTTTEAIRETTVRQEAEATIQRWFAHREDWIAYVREQSPEKSHKEIMRELCRRRADGQSCWDIVGLYSHVDICNWFKTIAESAFPTVSLLSRLWLGRSLSTAFQERVFSSAGAVMSSSRTTIDPARAEKLVILKHNADEITRMVSDEAS